MKSILLPLALASVSSAQAVLDAVNALPDDQPPMPTGFHVSRTYGDNSDSPVSIELTWDGFDGTPVLEYIGATDNPNGPQNWTEIPVAGVVGPNGEKATLTLQQRVAQTIHIRLRAQVSGVSSEPSVIGFTSSPP